MHIFLPARLFHFFHHYCNVHVLELRLHGKQGGSRSFGFRSQLIGIHTFFIKGAAMQLICMLITILFSSQSSHLILYIANDSMVEFREPSGSVVECLTEGPRVWASRGSLHCGPWARHINPSLVLVQPRKTCPYITKRLLMGRKESNQTNKNPPLLQGTEAAWKTVWILISWLHQKPTDLDQHCFY